MPTNTIYNPKTLNEFTKDHLEFAGRSIFITASVDSTAEGDLFFSEDMLLTGGELLVENGAIEDLIYLQVIHPIYGVVKEFITGYHVAPDSVRQISLQIHYPSKLTAGLSIRCKYVAAAGGASRKIAVNLFLHRVLE